ncbi:NAD(P)/FAD-dependent oxidoreductase [Pseudohongiella sp.]|uniref:FAD/NAD(P)-binding domain-containing protein n=1 Tax=marine sediment metagenome TaxID=412755 RepID=A0A0F9WGS2_9ZZZZ|nr:FAD/NAD(P)-binding oxidoreductase [Pseudohongiella sp.]HDZ09097.1 NAD(P)/FAD-dependent oxidoreductase [Pseudohongiella sp.]HEA63567.1 NAD(P)/FAD-dependent oxidoreductase [Pseudohongiella sp.]
MSDALALKDSNSDARCLIIGASHAGSQLAVNLRKNGWTGEIVLLGSEAQLPYHRPPLSKTVMAGSKTLDNILLRPEAMYASNDITLRLASDVASIMPEQKQVVLAGGETLTYDKLALCTGARPIKLPLGDGLDGVCYLRSYADVETIRQQLEGKQRAVVIGAGYIGLEAAAVMTQLGLQVTVLERADRVLQRVTGEQVSQYFTDLHRSHGVEIVCGAEVTGINGQHVVDSVHCADGSSYPADIVIVGIGVTPETRLAQDAGLRIENGVYVDEYCRTSDADIYAAGDCASYPDARYQRRVRLESVQNANDQARIAAINICGGNAVYQVTPWFWSDQFDIKLQSVGLSDGFDEAVLDGSLDPADAGGFVIQYLRAGRLIAADCVRRPKDFMALKAKL